MPLYCSVRRMFVIVLFCTTCLTALAQFKRPVTGLHFRVRQAGVARLLNGIDVQSGDLRLKVVALREDVVRVTYARGKSFPEDASWAVLPEARRNSVPVSIDQSSDHFVFRTHSLAIEVDKRTLEVKVLDLSGNILEQDAGPVRFDGDAFQIRKKMPLDEHYFGLGDKTGPLDRRN